MTRAVRHRHPSSAFGPVRCAVRAAVLVCAASALAHAAAAADRVTLQLAWDHQFQFAGFYAADWQGYYSEAGLAVHIRPGVRADRSILIATKELEAGRADFAIGGANTLVEVDRGVPLRVLAVLFQKSPAAFYYPARLGRLTPADLVNLRVAMPAGGINDAEFQSMMRAEGIDPARVTYRPHRPGLSHLAAGEVDVALGYTIASPWIARQRGLDVRALSASSYGVDFYGDSLVTHQRVIDRDPEMVRRFVDASLKGWRYALSHPDEIAARIAAELPRAVPLDDPVGFNRFQAAAVKKLMLYPLVAPGNINIRRWEQMHRALLRAGVVSGRPDIGSLVYDPEKAAAEFNARILKAALLAAIVAILSLGGLFGFNRMLRRTVATRTAALSESEERYRALAELSPEPVIVQRARVVAYVNQAALDMFGATSADQLIGRATTELLHPDSKPQLHERRRQLVATGGPLPFREIKFLKLDGSTAVVETAVTAFTWQGAPATLVVARDITERKRVEEALRASEQRHRLLVETSPYPAIVDRDGTIVFANPAAVEAFAAGSVAALVGRNALDLIHPGDHALVTARRGNSAGEEQLYSPMDRRYRRLDGSEFIGESRAARFRWGGEAAWLVTIRDITESRRMETALRESEARLNALFTEAPAGLAIIDHNLRYVNINETLADLNGWSVADHIGRSVAEILPGELGEMTSDTMRTVLRTGEPLRNAEMSGPSPTKPDETGHWVASMFPMPGAHGSPDSLGIIVVDVTPRKQAEQALRESEARFRAFVDNSPYAIALKDVEGRFFLVNRKFCEGLDKTVEETIGLTAHDVLPEELADLYARMDRRVVETGSVVEEELSRPVEGSAGHFLVVKFPVVDRNGKVAAIGVIGADMTRRKLLEEHFAEAQKMEAVGHLTGGMAHEFNNLLQAILGYLELLGVKIGDDRVRRVIGGDDCERLVAGATRATLEAAEITRNLLAFARKQPLRSRAVDLSEIVSGVREMIRGAVSETITIDSDIAEAPWPAVADPSQVQSALVNLVFNARDAMPDGGALTIELGNASVTADEALKFGDDAVAGDYVRLAVRDTGNGIPPAVLERVFEPFFTTKDIGQGTGLGLSMVYGFARQSDGFVHIESRVGGGTTVALYLPSAAEADVGRDDDAPARAFG